MDSFFCFWTSEPEYLPVGRINNKIQVKIFFALRLKIDLLKEGNDYESICGV